MRPDEPGPWELHRSLERFGKNLDTGLAQIHARLDRLVTTETFTAERQRVDDKLRDLAQDIADERELRKEDVVSLRRQQEAQHGDAVAAKRWAITALIAGGGVLIALVGLIIQLLK